MSGSPRPQTRRTPATAGGGRLLARALSYTESVGSKASRIREQLGLPDSLTLLETAEQAEAQLGMDAGAAPLSVRMNVLLDEMGIGRLAAATTPPIVMGSIIAAEQTSTDDVLLDVEAAVPMESKGASTTSAPGIVASVDGRWGKHVFQIQFTLRDGNLLTYGGTGYGRKCEPFTLHEGERIVRVTQHWSNKFHGARILVDSSEGRQFKVIGVHSTVGDRKIKVQADDGCEIVGLAFEGGMLVGAQVRSGITGQVQLIDSMECVPKLTGTDVGAPTAEPATAEPATAEPAMVEHATAESARLPGAPVRVEYAAGGVDLRPLVKFGCCFVTTWLLHVGNLIATLIVLLIPRDPCEAGGEVACPGSLLGIPAPYPMPFAVFIAFFTTMQHFMDSRAKMRALREKTLEAPRLATELQLREYVQSMQTARVELCFHVRSHKARTPTPPRSPSCRARACAARAERRAISGACGRCYAITRRSHHTASTARAASGW